MSIKYIFLLSSLLFIFSCKKDKKEELQITTITMTPGEGPISLDVDMNGSPDIKVYVDHPRMPGGAYWARCIVACMSDDVELRGNIQVDTLFKNTTFTNEIPGTLPNNYVNYGYTYTRISPADSILKTEDAFKLDFLDSWQKSGNNGSFKSGTFLLRDIPHVSAPSGTVVINDTLRFIHSSYSENFNPFPLKQTKFIGLRIKSKEGYIKLSMVSNYEFNVIESGILK